MSCGGGSHAAQLRLQILQHFMPETPREKLDAAWAFVSAGRSDEEIDGRVKAATTSEAAFRNAIVNKRLDDVMESQLPGNVVARLHAGGYTTIGQLAQVRDAAELNTLVPTNHVGDVVRLLSSNGLRLGMCPNSLRDWIQHGIF